MRMLQIHLARVLIYALVLALALVLLGSIAVTAQGPDGTRGGGTAAREPTPAPSGVSPETTATLTKYVTYSLKGGYVAHGLGLRNKGSGTIGVWDIPAGSTKYKAFLFWAVMGPSYMPGYYYYKGTFNGHAISGTLVGKDRGNSWWTSKYGDPPIWAYRADVTAWVNPGGNGSYPLSGFASGLTDGSDPFYSTITPPLLEGATLVIVYLNNNRPLTKIQIYNGAKTTWGEQLHLSMTGLLATAPTGFAYTTFIGADGQSNYSEPGSTFFTTYLPTVDWDGTDPNGAGYDYSYGNLWDTETVDVHSLLEPPENDFWVTTEGYGDYLTWVAQVVSYSSGDQDTDGDRLKDGWELNGYRNPATGSLVDLPAMGANPFHKDLFVEADYMVHPDTGEDHLPDKAHLDDIVNVFDTAPVSNPDGTTGVHIYLDTGGAAHGAAPGTYPAYNLGDGNNVGYQQHLGADTPNCNSYDWSQFDAKKNANFSSARTKLFHYMIFAHDLAPCFGSVSGMSRNGSTDALFIQGATNFIVSLGSWGGEGSMGGREGTFTHELGHNLGLRHGGNDHNNYKPNYLSIMNYFFQTSGLYRNGGWGNYDYSRALYPSLNETALNEVNGLGPLATSYGTQWFCPNGTVATDLTAGSYIDWNCDGHGTDASVQVNVNRDTSCYPNYCPVYSALGNQKNWASITFQGGGVIGTGVSSVSSTPQGPSTTRWVKELTFEENEKLSAPGK